MNTPFETKSRRKNESRCHTVSLMSSSVQPLSLDRATAQPLSMERANAPILQTATAPFAGKSTRKRAYVNASFYSECFLHGVKPLDADTGALDAQNRYEKWWQKTAYHGPPQRKRPKMQEEESQLTPSSGTTQGAIDDRKSAPRQVSEDDSSTVAQSHRRSRLEEPVSIREILTTDITASQVMRCKHALIRELRTNGGDCHSLEFGRLLATLQASFASRNWDVRWDTTNTNPAPLDGNWLTLSKPTFSECQGRNQRGEYLYSLGRLSFDMFRPTNLLCSVQGVFITIRKDAKRRVVLPNQLERALARSPESHSSIRSYKYVSPISRDTYISLLLLMLFLRLSIVVALTIVPNQTKRGDRMDESSTNQRSSEYVLKRPIRALYV